MSQLNSSRSASVGAARVKKMKARDELLEVFVSFLVENPIIFKPFYSL
jgi:hypothetical protein